VQGSAPKPVKRKLVGLLQGCYVRLAKLGAASRLVEALFVWCDVSDKELIAQPLSNHLTELKVRCLASADLQAYSHRSVSNDYRVIYCTESASGSGSFSSRSGIV
jgi:hypothetical protein